MLYDPWGMGSIRVFVRCFRERFDRLDVLVNNAGAITPDRRETADGLELQFGVNRIVHLLLTIPPWDLQERSG